MSRKTSCARCTRLGVSQRNQALKKSGLVARLSSRTLARAGASYQSSLSPKEIPNAKIGQFAPALVTAFFLDIHLRKMQSSVHIRKLHRKLPFPFILKIRSFMALVTSHLRAPARRAIEP